MVDRVEIGALVRLAYTQRKTWGFIPQRTSQRRCGRVLPGCFQGWVLAKTKRCVLNHSSCLSARIAVEMCIRLNDVMGILLDACVFSAARAQSNPALSVPRLRQLGNDFAQRILLGLSSDNPIC